MKRQFQPGDRVLYQYTEAGSLFCSGVAESVVLATSGKLVHVNYHNRYGMERDEWVKARKLKLIDAQQPKAAPQRPAVVDALVLEELTAIQASLGSASALLDLLREIRKSYETNTTANNG